MTRSLLVAPAAEGVGLTRTCLGLLRALYRSGVHVAYVKPVAQPGADGDLVGFILGSTAHKVIHLTDWPVLIVK
jgi:phosphate acetyltransferase